MRYGRFFPMAFLALSLTGGVALAHHHDGQEGKVGDLIQETRALTQQVQYSSLGNNVKRAVFNFSSAVERLWACVESSPERDTDRHHHDQVPAQCRYQMDAVRGTFHRVDYYLSDATEFPGIFDYYQDTKEVLYLIP